MTVDRDQLDGFAPRYMARETAFASMDPRGTCGDDGLIAASLGHDDQANHDHQLQGGA